MYKETLPPDCPYSDAKEDEKKLFRIIPENPVSENCFRSYVSLHPHRKDFTSNCKAHGLSFFDSREIAIQYVKRNPSLGSFVAEVEIKPEYGKLLLTNKRNGHYTLWLYKTFDPSRINCKIEPIQQDAAIIK